MPRVISQAITLTKLRDYQWRVRLGPNGLVVTEEYVVTDEDYEHSEPRRFRDVGLSAVARGAITQAVRNSYTEAATREGVERE